MELPHASVVLEDTLQAQHPHAHAPAPPITQALQRPHTAPSAPTKRSLGSHPAPATHAWQDGRSSDRASACDGGTRCSASEGCQVDRKTKHAPMTDTLEQAKRAACGASPGRRAVARPFSCRPQSRSRHSHGHPTQDSPRLPSGHTMRRCASAMSRSQERALHHCRALAEAAADAGQGGGGYLEAGPAWRPHSSGAPQPHANLDHKPLLAERAVQSEFSKVSLAHCLEPSCASLALTSAACTSMHTFHPPSDLITEHTTASWSSRHDRPFQVTATGERSWSAMSHARCGPTATPPATMLNLAIGTAAAGPWTEENETLARIDSHA